MGIKFKKVTEDTDGARSTNDNDIHRNMVDVAKALTNKVRNHSVRISQNGTDSPIARPKSFRNFSAKNNKGIGV